VATGVRAPAQMAWLPDGRLLVSDADGRVRLVRPGEAENRDPALGTSMLASESIGPMGLASHPDFAQNRLVYLSLLERDRAGETRLRVVRLREVGDMLGEAATLFEAPVADDGAAQTGPRMAFGPDRLLYVMLPPGMEFVNEPAASTPRASMLRLAEDGRATSLEPLSGITASPLAFTWHPTTGALWVMFRGESGEAAVRSLGARARVQTAQTMSAEAPQLRVREGSGTAAGTLLLQSAPDDLLVAQALLGTRADGLKGLARLALPVQATGQDGGISDRVGDVVAGESGTLFVATSNGLVGGDSAAAADVVVRLTPVRAAR
jgi:glucose/arabinose dehydrogenase